MQTLPPSPPELPLRPHALLARVPGLHASRRGSRVLVVDPRSARWEVLEDDEWTALGRLARPVTAREGLQAARAHGWDEPRALAWMRRMMGAGFVVVDGRRVSTASTSWPPPPDEIRFVSLHVTEGCNLSCRYCYAEALPAAPRMSRESMQGAVERVLRELPSRTLTIDFLGGEPLLAYGDLVDTVRHGRALAASLGKQVEFILQTNGLLLTRERAQELKDLGVGVGVSIDGPALLHDRHRVTRSGQGTHDVVLRHLLEARDVGLQVGPLAVVHEADAFVEVLDFFLEHGFVFMRLNPASVMGRARELPEITHQEPERFAHGLLAMARRALAWCEEHDHSLRIQDLDHMLTALTTQQRNYMCMRSPCGMGRSILSLGPQGEIYACEEMERTTRPHLLLGHLADGPLPEVLEHSPALARLKDRRIENIPRCSRCHLRHVCGGGCAHKALAAFGDLLREDPRCRYYQVALEELMWWLHDEPRALARLGIPSEVNP